MSTPTGRTYLYGVQVCTNPSWRLKIKNADSFVRLVFTSCDCWWSWFCHNRVALMFLGYRFWKDPLWWFACLAYTINRFIIAPLVGGSFFKGHFNDLWLIPAALPPVLELQSRLRLRTAGVPPSTAEVAAYWLLWSIISEVIAPFLLAGAVADWWDVLAYAVGACIAAVWWRKRWRKARNE